MPILLMKLVFGHLPRRVPGLMRPVARMISSGADKQLLAPQIASHFGFLEGELAGRDWFAGPEFTAADVQMSFPIEAAAARAGLDARLPRLKGFVERIQARPAYRRALEKGGPHTLLK
jgi:glutathione S-transferase